MSLCVYVNMYTVCDYECTCVRMHACIYMYLCMYAAIHVQYVLHIHVHVQ